MKLFLIIAIFVLFVLYLPPTVRFVAKRTSFSVKLSMYYIMDGRYFADQIVKGVRFSEMSQ